MSGQRSRLGKGKHVKHFLRRRALDTTTLASRTCETEQRHWRCRLGALIEFLAGWKASLVTSFRQAYRRLGCASGRAANEHKMAARLWPGSDQAHRDAEGLEIQKRRQQQNGEKQEERETSHRLGQKWWPRQHLKEHSWQEAQKGQPRIMVHPRRAMQRHTTDRWGWESSGFCVDTHRLRP